MKINIKTHKKSKTTVGKDVVIFVDTGTKCSRSFTPYKSGAPPLTVPFVQREQTSSKKIFGALALHGKIHCPYADDTVYSCADTQRTTARVILARVRKQGQVPLAAIQPLQIVSAQGLQLRHSIAEHISLRMGEGRLVVGMRIFQPAEVAAVVVGYDNQIIQIGRDLKPAAPNLGREWPARQYMPAHPSPRWSGFNR